MRKACAAIGWILALTIVVLSSVPPSVRPTTDASHNVEHFAIFFATGIAFAIGYRDRLPLVVIALIVFCGLVEVAQFWSPGRHARLIDFLVDAAATCAGAVAVFIAEWIWRRHTI